MQLQMSYVIKLIGQPRAALQLAAGSSALANAALDQCRGLLKSWSG